MRHGIGADAFLRCEEARLRLLAQPRGRLISGRGREAALVVAQPQVIQISITSSAPGSGQVG